MVQSELHPLHERICCNSFLFLFILFLFLFIFRTMHSLLLLGATVVEIFLYLRQMLLLTIARKKTIIAELHSIYVYIQPTIRWSLVQ